MAIAKFDKKCVDRSDRNTGQSGGIRSGKIERKLADNLQKFLLCDSGTPIIHILNNNSISLASIKDI